MPGSLVKRHELGRSTTAIDKKVRRHRHAVQILQGRIYRYIERIEEKVMDQTCAEFSRRQGDAVNDDQADLRRVWPPIAVRRALITSPGQSMIVFDVQCSSPDAAPPLYLLDLPAGAL